MKKLILLFFAIASFGASAQTAKRTPSNIGYLEYLPDKPTNRVIIYLHGSGAGGTGSAADLKKVEGQGLPWCMVDHYTGSTKTWTGLDIPFIVLAPQQAANKNGYVGNPGLCVKFIQELIPIYGATDIFITGFSMGADGAWYTVAKDSTGTVRGIVPVAPANTDYKIGKAVGQKGIPVRVFWGANDNYYKSGTIIPHYQAPNGYKAGGGIDINVTVYPVGGHDAATWRQAYGDLTLYAWMSSLCQSLPVPEEPGIYIDGKFAGADSVNFCNSLITIKK